MARKVAIAAAEQVAQYERLVATIPGVERKGATMPYTSLNGNMFSYLDTSGTMALRLSPDDRTAFIVRYGAKLQEAYGFVQKEYVAVPDGLLVNKAELRPWFEASYRYASGLKPKPAKRGDQGAGE